MPQSKEQKTITNIYAILTVSLLLSFLPMASAAFLASLIFIGVWIAAYMIRRKHDHASLIADHMTFIIRTIWIAGLFTLITMSAATVYILSVYDPTMMMDCEGAMQAGTSMADLENMVAPCYEEFLRVNMPYFIRGGLMAAIPIVIYMGYRLAKGVSRAVKGHRIGDTKSWF